MDELKFALDTFYAVMAGALVMWMAAGFTMLEAGLVQKKDVSEIVTKNLGLNSLFIVLMRTRTGTKKIRHRKTKHQNA